jgi:two-component system, OmpR family, response regulator
MSRIQDQRSRAWTKRRNYVEGKQPRVLVVDDNRSAAEALVAFLGLENLETRPAFGGVEAMEVARRWLPDLIVMDISMPRCNGFEASRAIRADAQTHGIAIVAFTALDEYDVRCNLTDDEMDGYCQKGQSPTTLLALIWTFLLKKA